MSDNGGEHKKMYGLLRFYMGALKSRWRGCLVVFTEKMWIYIEKHVLAYFYREMCQWSDLVDIVLIV